jgi:charged multivesicular body protein 2A
VGWLAWLRPLSPLLTDRPAQLVDAPTGLATTSTLTERQPVALGDGPAPLPGATSSGGFGGGGNSTDEDALQARLDALRRG